MIVFHSLQLNFFFFNLLKYHKLFLTPTHLKLHFRAFINEYKLIFIQVKYHNVIRYFALKTPGLGRSCFKILQQNIHHKTMGTNVFCSKRNQL